MSKHAILTATCLLLTVSLPARADLTVAAAAQARYSDNVGNAQGSDDKVSDESLAAKVSLSDALPLDSAYLLSIGAGLGGQWFDHLQGLRNASIDGSISLRRRWGLGAFAPWMRAGLTIGRSEYDYHYRDFNVYRAALSGGKRLSSRSNLWFEYAFEHRSAQAAEAEIPTYSADAFSGSAHSLTASYEYTLIDRLFLDLSTSARRGAIVSTSRPEYSEYLAAHAIAEDPAFGDEWYAYRLLGNSYAVRAGISAQVSEHHLVGIGAQRVRTYAGGNDYANTIAEFTWDYRF